MKIALGDLRHRTAGKHSFFMPIGIGYIASYTLLKMESKNVEIRLYDDSNVILKDIVKWKPAVLGLSNYCWNSELSKVVFQHARKFNPSVVCVSGGPEFPADHVECKAYLSKRQEIDFYVYLEGEYAFAELIKKISNGSEISYLKSEPQDGIMSIHPRTGELIYGKPMPRIMNMDEIPSPYLSGLMDQWFDGCYAPSIEIARGCPFSCGFCFQGQPWFNRLATFSIERIKDELTYIAKRISEYPDILLSICDSNFGMNERDEKIAEHIRSLQDKFGWPNAFDVTTGKANYDRILKIISLLKNRMQISCSVQSLNPKTLDVIKRKNPPNDIFKKINIEMKKHGMNSGSELIVPMPEETKESFFEGLKSVVDLIGVDRVIPYTTMLLKGTYLASKECRKKYKMQTKFRIVPRQFGEYLGKKCFEIEEVCISTNTMSFDDYLEIRGFALISSFFSSRQFDSVHRHLKELGIGSYDYLYYLWEYIKSGKTMLSKIYNLYIQESTQEMWNSREDIYDYFSKQDNYNKLLNGYLGDNLIRKYSTRLLLDSCIPSIELAYSAIKHIAQDVVNEEIKESLAAAKAWMITLRNVSAVFQAKSYIDITETIHLHYDVNSWYQCSSDDNNLLKFKQPTSYRVFCDRDNLNKIFQEAEKLFGGDLSYRVGKLLINWSLKHFWRKCIPSKNKIK